GRVRSITGSGTVSPGDAGVGTLTVADSSDLNGTFAVDVSGASSDLLSSTAATIDLNGTELVLDVNTPTPGTAYRIVSSAAGGITGTFNGLPNGAVFTSGGVSFTIPYSPTAVTLTRNSLTVDAGPDQAVPERRPVTLQGSFTDPGSLDAPTASWRVVGDRPGPEVATGDGPSLTFTPAHDGTYTATLTVVDKAGATSQDVTQVRAANVDVTAIGVGPGDPPLVRILDANTGQEKFRL